VKVAKKKESILIVKFKLASFLHFRITYEYCNFISENWFIFCYMDLNPGTVTKTLQGWNLWLGPFLGIFPSYKGQVEKEHFIYKALISVICCFNISTKLSFVHLLACSHVLMYVCPIYINCYKLWILMAVQ